MHTTDQSLVWRLIFWIGVFHPLLVFASEKEGASEPVESVYRASAELEKERSGEFGRLPVAQKGAKPARDHTRIVSLLCWLGAG